MANIPGVTCPISPLAQDNKTGSAAQQQLNDKKGWSQKFVYNKTTIIDSERHASHADSIPEDEEMDMEM